MSKTEAQIEAGIQLGNRIAAGCSREEFEAMRCPVCGEPVTLNTHVGKGLFFLRCAKSSLHVSATGRAVGPVPAWWAALEGGWMVD